ncbi:MAG: GyrI-like domain-containing protein [Methanoregula sp.]
MEDLTFTIQEMPEKTVMGIGRRTCNADGKSVEDIPACWQEFLATKAAAKIRHRAMPPSMLAVYSHYDSDWKGEYSYLIGCGVTKVDGVPKGMTVEKIPAQKYAVFPARGPMPDAVIGVWATIWGSDLPRTYSADFEVYDSRFTHKTNPEVDVYVGVRDE